VRVAVKGELDACVPEQVLNQLRVGTARPQESSARVPQIVLAHLRQPRPPKQGLEVTVDDVLGVHRRADRGDEHKPVISPSSARSKLLLCLPLTVAPEGFYGPLRQG
jgi:hypothetical protein